MTPTSLADQGETTLELIRLFVLLVGASALVTYLARRIALPYTVALVAFGMAAGALSQPLHVQITPQLVLVVLLPGLIFEASYQIDFDKLRPSMAGVALLAGPGVLVSATLVALFLSAGAGLPLPQAFVVGAMVSATDPAAVIATFKRLRSPRRLATLIEAESLFNDGTGIVLFSIAVAFVTRPVSPVEMGLAFISVVAVSAAIGGVAGFVASRILPGVGDHLIEISLSVVLAYGTYLAADAIHQSGVIATAVAGLVLGNYGRRLGLSKLTEEALDTVWEFVAFLATAIVFLLVGFAISAGQLAGAAAPIAWAVAAALLGRAIIVYGLLGGFQAATELARRARDGRAGRTPAPAAAEGEAVAAEGRATAAEGQAVAVRDGPVPSGPGSGRRPTRPGASGRPDEGRSHGDRKRANWIPSAWLHVIFWSGLRGAVGTALALSLPADFPNRVQLQGITLGVVLFTLLVQATTAELVVNRWGLRQTRSPGAAWTTAEDLLADGPLGEGPLAEDPLAEGPLGVASRAEGKPARGRLPEAPLMEGPLVERPVVERSPAEGPPAQAPQVEAPLSTGARPSGEPSE